MGCNWSKRSAADSPVAAGPYEELVDERESARRKFPASDENPGARGDEAQLLPSNTTSRCVLAVLCAARCAER
jgi:hypothetical protein